MVAWPGIVVRVTPTLTIILFNILLSHSFPGSPSLDSGDELSPCLVTAGRAMPCLGTCVCHRARTGTCTTGLLTCKILITAKALGIESKLLGCHSLLTCSVSPACPQGAAGTGAELQQQSHPALCAGTCLSSPVAAAAAHCSAFPQNMAQAVLRAPEMQENSVYRLKYRPEMQESFLYRTEGQDSSVYRRALCTGLKYRTEVQDSSAYRTEMLESSVYRTALHTGELCVQEWSVGQLHLQHPRGSCPQQMQNPAGKWSLLPYNVAVVPHQCHVLQCFLTFYNILECFIMFLQCFIMFFLLLSKCTDSVSCLGGFRSWNPSWESSLGWPWLWAHPHWVWEKSVGGQKIETSDITELKLK